MTFKKVLAIFLVLCMVFGIAACGVKSSDDEDSSDKSSSKSSSKSGLGGLFSNNKDSSGSTDEDTSDSTDEDTSDSSDSSSSTDEDTSDNSDSSSSTDESASDSSDSSSDVTNPLEGLTSSELPKGYPEDKYPFMKGTVITYGIQGEESGRTTFVAMATSPKKLQDVVKYYTDLLAQAENKEDYSSDGYYTLTGKFGGYEFQLMLAKDQSNADYTGVSLGLQEIPSADAALKNMESSELPENYPADKFPIVDGGVVTDATESESDGVVSYDITVYTTLSFKDIVSFYEGSLGTIEDKSKSVNTDNFSLQGTANGYYFYLSGYISNENGVDLSEYTISIDPVTE